MYASSKHSWIISYAVIYKFITSHLDYSNSLYIGLPLITIQKFQLVQHMGNHIVMKILRFTHITHYYRSYFGCQLLSEHKTRTCLTNLIPYMAQDLEIIFSSLNLGVLSNSFPLAQLILRGKNGCHVYDLPENSYNVAFVERIW